MHGVAEAGSVRASQWLRREHAVYMATPLLALNAWLGPNIKKRTQSSLRGQTRGSVCVGSDLSHRNVIKFGIGITQGTAEVSDPLLVYIDFLALLYLLHAYTMYCVVTVSTLSDIESNTLKYCPALPGAWVPANANADTHAEPL